MKNIKREAGLYLVFGVLTTAVDYVAALLFYHVIGCSALTSNNVAWVFSVAFAYLTNKWFVFESKSWEFKVIGKEIAGFISARLFTLLGADAIIWIAGKLGIAFFFSKIISSVFVVVLNYVLSKCMIFKSKKVEEKSYGEA